MMNDDSYVVVGLTTETGRGREEWGKGDACRFELQGYVRVRTAEKQMGEIVSVTQWS